MGPTRSLTTYGSLCSSQAPLSLLQAWAALPDGLQLTLNLPDPSALLPDLGLLNLTQKLATRLLDCSGLKVSQVNEVIVPMVIIGLPHDRHDIYSLCQQILIQHLLCGGLCGGCRPCIVSAFLELSFWWDPEDRASLLFFFFFF